jgi:hypothetical protein
MLGVTGILIVGAIGIVACSAPGSVRVKRVLIVRRRACGRG